MAESPLIRKELPCQETGEEEDAILLRSQRQEAPTLPLTAQHSSASGQETGIEEDAIDIQQKKRQNSNHENIAPLSESEERWTSDLHSPREEAESSENANQEALTSVDDTEESAHSDCNISEEEYAIAFRQQQESNKSIDDSNQESLTRPVKDRVGSSSEFHSSKEKHGQRPHTQLSEHQDSSPPGHKIHSQRNDGNANALTLRKQCKVPDKECATYKRQEPKIKNKKKVSKKVPDLNQKSSNAVGCDVSELEQTKKNEIFNEFFHTSHHPGDQSEGKKVRKAYIVAQLILDKRTIIRTYESKRKRHAEQIAIDDLVSILLDPDHGYMNRNDCVLELYINMSPCSDCSVRLQQFLKDMKNENISITLKIAFVSLYRIILPHCLENCEHGMAQPDQHDSNLEGLRNLAKCCSHFGVFDKSQWTKLREILQAKVPPNQIRLYSKGSRAKHDKRLACFLKKENIGQGDKRMWISVLFSCCC